MGINIETEDRYAASVRALFPPGAYWDGQFADPKSDCSIFCMAKAREIVRFRRAMADILRESNFRTSVDTIGDWERTLLGRCNVTLSLEKRRALLLIKQTPGINRRLFEDAARTFGMKLTGIEFPFRPGFFGFSRCGIDRAASPAAYSVLFITAAKPDGEAETEEFEAVIKEIMSTNYIPYFFYQNGGR